MKRCRQFAQTAPPKTSLQGKLVLLGATAGGIGYTPIFPGTVGTVAAIPFSFGLELFCSHDDISPAVSFLLFRFFDIAKVFPASRLEWLPGGAGIVLDDIMAGIYTFALTQLLIAWGII